MDHELLDHKTDFFADRDEAFSSLKQEFSKIFHENNLHSYTNASDIGFLDLGKQQDPDYPTDLEDFGSLNPLEKVTNRPYQKSDASPYLGLGVSYSPMRFLQSGLNPNVNFHHTSFDYMTAIQHKFATGSDQPLYQAYQPYKYADYGYYDSQPVNLYVQHTYDGYGQVDLLDSQPNNALSLMWSNDTKGLVKRNPSEDYLSQQQTLSINRLSSTEQDTPKKISPLKIEQDIENVSKKTLELQLDRASKAIPETTTTLPRRTTRAIKPIFKQLQEDDDSGSDDDRDESYGDSKNRSSRGLRVLSLKVREIVSRKKKTSYKEVAEALLKDLSEKLKGKSQAEISKEEQNVKRRVYDALNVLIAAEILRKDGKLVCCETNPVSASNSLSKKKTKETTENLLQQIEEAKKRKAEKLEGLQELIFKSLAVKNLVRRNKEKAQVEMVQEKNEGGNIGENSSTTILNGINMTNVNATRIDVVQENAELKSKNQDVISFPFIVLVSSSPENAMNLNMDASQKQLSIDSKKAFNIYGDIDVLLKMKLHYVSKEIFQNEVPKELKKYVSQSFFDAIN